MLKNSSFYDLRRNFAQNPLEMPRQMGGRAEWQNPMPGQKDCFKRLSARGNGDTFCLGGGPVK
jgi:hypothetical protein